MKRVALAALVAVVLAARTASAHPVPFSYVDVRVEEEAVRMTIVAHIFDVAHELALEPPERLLQPDEARRAADAISRLLSPRLALVIGGNAVHAAWSEPAILEDRQSLRFSAEFPIARPGPFAVQALLFPYDPNHQTFVNVYEGDALTSQTILDASRRTYEYFPDTPRGRAAVSARFFTAGVRHIVAGPDHLLFLVGVLLLGGSLRRLGLIASAFTGAQALTMALASWNLVTPSPRVVEPAIALSIVYIGVDNLLVRGGRDVRAWIAFAFGFIHGFGYANMLRAMNLPSAALGWSVLAFNVGVEAGQLVVVGVLATALATVRSHSERAWRRLAVAGSIVVLAAGGFWFVERVFFM